MSDGTKLALRVSDFNQGFMLQWEFIMNGVAKCVVEEAKNPVSDVISWLSNPIIFSQRLQPLASAFEATEGLAFGKTISCVPEDKKGGMRCLWEHVYARDGPSILGTFSMSTESHNTVISIRFVILRLSRGITVQVDRCTVVLDPSVDVQDVKEHLGISLTQCKSESGGWENTETRYRTSLGPEYNSVSKYCVYAHADVHDADVDEACAWE